MDCIFPLELDMTKYIEFGLKIRCEQVLLYEFYFEKEFELHMAALNMC